MDDFSFWALPFIGRPEVHFSDKPVVYGWNQTAINLGEPYLFGAALHSVQDWYSHYNEGYRWPSTLGHLYQTAIAKTRSVELNEPVVLRYLK